MTSLAPKTVTLLRLSVATVLGDWDLLRELRLAAGPDEPDRSWREAILQTHLFAGFPRLVEAFGVLEEAGGLGQIDDDERSGVRSEEEDLSAGYEFFERVYGHRAPRVREMLESYHPDWGRWILGHAYGRVLSRPGLDAAARELCAVVSLAALSQDRQLASHARGAVRCGATPQDLLDALAAVADRLTEGNLARAERVIRAFSNEG
jgi:alkylhydroperoxidase/carboxymuconolactone decarboxylase family protein YurZ